MHAQCYGFQERRDETQKEESKLNVMKDLKFAYLVSQSAIKDLYCFLKEAIKYVDKNLA